MWVDLPFLLVHRFTILSVSLITYINLTILLISFSSHHFKHFSIKRCEDASKENSYTKPEVPKLHRGVLTEVSWDTHQGDHDVILQMASRRPDAVGRVPACGFCGA